MACDTEEANQLRLSQYAVNSAALLSIIGRYHLGFFEVLVDIFTLINTLFGHDLVQVRERRVRSFLQMFHASMKSTPHTTGQLFTSTFDVPSHLAISRANIFMHQLTVNLIRIASIWSVGKQVTVQLPLNDLNISNAVGPNFLVQWVKNDGIDVVGKDLTIPHHSRRCGRIYWTGFASTDFGSALPPSNV